MNIKGPQVAEFLKALLRSLRGPVDLFMDRGSIHKHHEVAQRIRASPRVRIHFFPAYAPELNPDEYVWTRSKQRLSNTCFTTLDELGTKVCKGLVRIQYSQSMLRSCIDESELPWRW